MKKYLISAISILIVAGCGGGGNTDTSKKIYPQSKKTFNVSETNQILKVTKTSNSQVTLNIDSPKDIYVVVTSHFNNQKISISSPSANAEVEQNSKMLSSNIKDDKAKTPQKVLDFRRNAPNLLHKDSINKNFKISKQLNRVTSVNENDSFTFCTDMNSRYACTNEVDAKAKKVVKNISTKHGNKNLVVWVENDEYNDGGFLSGGSINQTMVDKLANQFLQNSDNNGHDDDIYDWDTNIFGEEWGDNASSIDSGLIGNSDTINILIFNMHSDGLAGYFWPKDNFKKSKVSASNEKIMFYINSELYSENEKETFTTLAHEFQHMIHFYQRTVMKGLDDNTWFDEMMSETTEDLVAVKLKHKGPRNVDYRDGSAGSAANNGGAGKRYPIFNENNTMSLTTWGTGVTPYSKVSSFGAFLLRNYGGAKVLHDMMYSTSSDEQAVLDATGESSFETLLSKWAEGVILSDIDDLDSSKPKYNFGDFKETTYGGITYKLGSINFFNYSKKPKMNSSKTLNKDANLYYKVGNSLSGQVKIDVNIERGGDVIIIAK